MVGEAVGDDIALAKTAGEKPARCAPPVAATPLRLENRAGRHEELREPRDRRGIEPAQGRHLRLQLQEIGLARHRYAGERRARLDFLRLDGRENPGEAWRAALRMRE